MGIMKLLQLDSRAICQEIHIFKDWSRVKVRIHSVECLTKLMELLGGFLSVLLRKWWIYNIKGTCGIKVDWMYTCIHDITCG